MAIPYNQAMVFAKTDGWSFGTITVTPRILKVLSLIDGKKTIEEIRNHLSLSRDEIYMEIKKLQGLGLITFSTQSLQTSSDSSAPYDDEYFWNTLREIVAEI